eukprot:363588-Chlamydomonas_euryale.AAC.8
MLAHVSDLPDIHHKQASRDFTLPLLGSPGRGPTLKAASKDFRARIYTIEAMPGEFRTEIHAFEAASGDFRAGVHIL